MQDAPGTEFAWEAVVEIGETRSLGQGPLGERRIVPILGGRVEGPALRGRVLPGGADRQLVRPDGVRHLDALYEVEAEDGSVITVRNRVTIAGDYRRSYLQVQAPAGPHGWLNDVVLVGTLESLRPTQDAVRIRVYKLT